MQKRRGRYTGRNYERNRFALRKEPRYVDTYSAINHVTGEYIPCNDMNHSCAVAFGRNKKTHTQDWMACYFANGSFIVL